MKKAIIVVGILILLMCLVGCEEERTAAPPTLKYNDTYYLCEGGFIDSPAISKEYIGKVEREVPIYEFPQNNFEINIEGYLDCKMYLLEDGDIVVEYKGDQYGDWRRFIPRE